MNMGFHLIRHASLHDRLVAAFHRHSPQYHGEVLVNPDGEGRHKVAGTDGELAVIFDTSGWRIREIAASAS